MISKYGSIPSLNVKRVSHSGEADRSTVLLLCLCLVKDQKIMISKYGSIPSLNVKRVSHSGEADRSTVLLLCLCLVNLVTYITVLNQRAILKINKVSSCNFIHIKISNGRTVCHCNSILSINMSNVPYVVWYAVKPSDNPAWKTCKYGWHGEISRGQHCNLYQTLVYSQASNWTNNCTQLHMVKLHAFKSIALEYKIQINGE